MTGSLLYSVYTTKLAVMNVDADSWDDLDVREQVAWEAVAAYVRSLPVETKPQEEKRISPRRYGASALQLLDELEKKGCGPNVHGGL